MNYRCPVCFFDEMPDPPRDYNICPCCGTEFGNDDVEYSYAELRVQIASITTSGTTAAGAGDSVTVCEQSFLYFNKGWREVNKLELGIECDFDFTYGYSVEPDTSTRNEETKSYNSKYFNNVVQGLQVLLTKRPKGKK